MLAWLRIFLKIFLTMVLLILGPLAILIDISVCAILLPYQLWQVFYRLSRKVIPVFVASHTIRQLSDDPADPEGRHTVPEDSVAVEFYATKEEYEALVRAAGAEQVAFRKKRDPKTGHWFSPLGMTDKFVYCIYLVNRRRDA